LFSAARAAHEPDDLLNYFQVQQTHLDCTVQAAEASNSSLTHISAALLKGMRITKALFQTVSHCRSSLYDDG
jgi:hypothetical protein